MLEPYPLECQAKPAKGGLPAEMLRYMLAAGAVTPQEQGPSEATEAAGATVSLRSCVSSKRLSRCPRSTADQEAQLSLLQCLSRALYQ